jgi:hypothetical protein
VTLSLFQRSRENRTVHCGTLRTWAPLAPFSFDNGDCVYDKPADLSYIHQNTGLGAHVHQESVGFKRALQRAAALSRRKKKAIQND